MFYFFGKIYTRLFYEVYGYITGMDVTGHLSKEGFIQFKTIKYEMYKGISKN